MDTQSQGHPWHHGLQALFLVPKLLFFESSPNHIEIMLSHEQIIIIVIIIFKILEMKIKMEIFKVLPLH